MESGGRERGKEIGKQPAGGAKRQENAKKMLNRGNELRHLLKTQHLAFFGAKNELKTNSILRAKNANQSGKAGGRFQVSGSRWRRARQSSGVRIQETNRWVMAAGGRRAGARRADVRCPVPGGRG
jgi:hypothetical protein